MKCSWSWDQWGVKSHGSGCRAHGLPGRGAHEALHPLYSTLLLLRGRVGKISINQLSNLGPPHRLSPVVGSHIPKLVCPRFSSAPLWILELEVPPIARQQVCCE